MGEKNPGFFAFTLLVGILCLFFSIVILIYHAFNCNSGNLDSCDHIHSYSSSYKGLIAGFIMTGISILVLPKF